MLQDLSFGKMENAFHNTLPSESSIVICIQDGHILLHRDNDDTLRLPHYATAVQWAQDAAWPHWNDHPFQYVFRLQDTDYFVWMGRSGDCPDNEFHYESVRQLRQLVSKDLCFGMMTARHLYVWYQNNRFCGRCAAPTVHDSKERMLRCPECGNMIFPRISPAVIVAVTDSDRLLLSKYAGRAYTRYALIAGFTEIGETLEQTVAREVMEEVGLRVTNIRYYKSQPWGVDGNILAGFYCDLDGDDTIHIDETELSMAQWYPRDNLPAHDDGISLTREMIRVFEEGREPK